MVNESLKKIILPFYRLWYDAKWRFYVRNTDRIRIVVGSAQIGSKGWFETDILVLDLTNEQQFRRFFSRHPIGSAMAEHVIEHLTTEQIAAMLGNFHRYSTPDFCLRIAVPDGYHADPDYVENVRPGGKGAGADDHQHLFNHASLSALFAGFGFRAEAKEYWDAQRQFHSAYQNDERGRIRRSFINDSRNADGQPHYTSLIIDFIKQ